MEDTNNKSKEEDEYKASDGFFGKAEVLSEEPKMKITRVSLTDLLEKETRKEAVQSITNAFKEHGFFLLNLPEESAQWRAFQKARKASFEFFSNASLEDKEGVEMGDDQDIGYHLFPTVKEFFQVITFATLNYFF